MARVVFTSNLQRHVDCPETQVAAGTVHSVLAQVFAAQPRARGYVLAFGSTTGGLWLSQDQGDSWRCLSTQLPPIHCVRFG